MYVSRGAAFVLYMLPLWLVITFMAGCALIRFNIDPKVFYAENVCTYKGGQVQGDFCIMETLAIRLDVLAPLPKEK